MGDIRRVWGGVGVDGVVGGEGFRFHDFLRGPFILVRLRRWKSRIKPSRMDVVLAWRGVTDHVTNTGVQVNPS